jgi:hypothetical protein
LVGRYLRVRYLLLAPAGLLLRDVAADTVCTSREEEGVSKVSMQNDPVFLKFEIQTLNAELLLSLYYSRV